jgi:hypothetical protein
MREYIMSQKSKIKTPKHKKIKIRIPLPKQTPKVRESAKKYNRNPKHKNKDVE